MTREDTSPFGTTDADSRRQKHPLLLFFLPRVVPPESPPLPHLLSPSQLQAGLEREGVLKPTKRRSCPYRARETPRDDATRRPIYVDKRMSSDLHVYVHLSRTTEKETQINLYPCACGTKQKKKRTEGSLFVMRERRKERREMDVHRARELQTDG